jgi:hypothetical protein
MKDGLSIWDMVYRYNYLPYRSGHPGYRYGIRANDVGDDSIDMVILHVDMGYLVTLPAAAAAARPPRRAWSQGLTLAHFSAQLERFVWDRICA